MKNEIMGNKVKIISIVIGGAVLVLVGFSIGKSSDSVLVKSGITSIEPKEKLEIEIQESSFEEVVSELDTPEKLVDYIKKNFRWGYHDGHVSFQPEEFFYIKDGDCKDLATFGSYVLEQHGYDVKIMCIGGKSKGQHAVTVFRDKNNELKYITNNVREIELIEVKSFDDILIRESERMDCEITKYGFVPAGSTYVWVDGL